MCFCAYKNFLPPFQVGIDATIFLMKDNNKTSRLYIRISDEENKRLRELAKDYPNLSSFVLDACWHFNGKRHLRRLDYIEEKYRILLSLKNDLSHLSGNLNQLVQYTNRCINMGVYLDNTADEVCRIEDSLLQCLSDYRAQIKSLEKELKEIIKKI